MRVLKVVRCAACGRAVSVLSWASDLCLMSPVGHRLTGEDLLALALRPRLERGEDKV